MGIIVKKEETYTIISVEDSSLSGELSAEFKRKAVGVLDSGEVNISLDLGKTDFIDSSGVGKLLFLNKKIEKIEGKFSIIKISRTLYEFLDSLAITRVIKISDPE
jgi:anti-sigma B factor antagonist